MGWVNVGNRFNLLTLKYQFKRDQLEEGCN